jgi:hypothetical protein
MTKAARNRGLAPASAGLAVLLLVLGAPRSVPAAGAEREAAVVSRALAFERSLDERVGSGAIGIAVIHKPLDAQSESCAREWNTGFLALSNVKIQDRSVVLKSFAYSEAGVGKARANGIHVFVVCPGLSHEAAEISRASRAQRILSVGTLVSYVEQSMAFGVFREQEKLQMVVNLRVAVGEGVTFSSSMLKLARVLR